MEFKVNNEIYYLNEALLLAVQIFSRTNANVNLALLNADFEKLKISEGAFTEKYENLINYYINIMNKGMQIKSKYKNLEDLLSTGEDNFTTLNILIFSKMKISIKDYTYEEFFELLKKDILENLETRSKDFDKGKSYLDMIDSIEYLNGAQKFALAKLFSKESEDSRDFYNMVIELEDIIKSEIHLVENLFYDEIKKINLAYLDKYKEFDLIKANEIYKSTKTIETLIYINNFTPLGFSIETDDFSDYTGYIILGFLHLVTKDYELKLRDRAEEVQEFLSVISESNRFKILYLLSKKSMFGQELADELGLSKASISQHLGQLQEKGIVSFKLSGRKIYYELTKAVFEKIINYFEDLIGVYYE